MHFEAIARGQDDEAASQPLPTNPVERILIGARLGGVLPLTRAILAEMDANADGQMELARRRIAMGLDLRRVDE